MYSDINLRQHFPECCLLRVVELFQKIFENSTTRNKVMLNKVLVESTKIE